MLDSMGRQINYLRISVTDRCNLRCRYCMPEEGIESIEHQQILSLEEIARIVKISTEIGINKVRLTGGEPLVRKNIDQLIAYMSEIKEIDDIAITTNGILFPEMADRLKEAGLNRVNISMDSLIAEKFKYISRYGDLSKVRNGIDKALELGMEPVKINVVVIKGFNDNELLDFAELAYIYPLHIRFIEFMPVGDLLYFKKERMMNSSEMKEILDQAYNLNESEKKVKGNGPARYYSIEGGKGSIGFINPMSHQFCSECNRIRMTADGKLRACLYDRREFDLRDALRQGASDEQLKQIFIKVINMKPARHNMNAGWGPDNRRKMYQIGG